MTLNIRTRDHGTISFWLDLRKGGTTGYVWFFDSEGSKSQPCRGGGFRGATLVASEATFERVCRRWWRQHLAKLRDPQPY